MEVKNTFEGFSPKTLEFLLGIEFNNRKDWYEEHKPDYREFVQKPFLSLTASLTQYMLSIDPAFETRGEKIISRIYRDVRFSKDKSPYRSSVWITYRRMNRDWKFDPCFFFEITPYLYRYGMGFYTAPKEAMLRLREMIDEDSEAFKRVEALYGSQELFLLEGETYKKILDRTKTESQLNWYQRKNIYFMRTEKISQRLFMAGLVDDVKGCFEMLKLFYEFLWKTKNEGEARIIR